MKDLLEKLEQLEQAMNDNVKICESNGDDKGAQSYRDIVTGVFMAKHEVDQYFKSR